MVRALLATTFRQDYVYMVAGRIGFDVDLEDLSKSRHLYHNTHSSIRLTINSPSYFDDVRETYHLKTEIEFIDDQNESYTLVSKGLLKEFANELPDIIYREHFCCAGEEPPARPLAEIVNNL